MGESTEAEWQLQTDNADSMALALSSEVGGRPPDDSDEESSESDGGESASEYPPGPICAEKCTLGGPGYVGGAARSTVSFFVTAKDERGTRIRDGGAYVVATITPGNSARAAGAEVLTASVKDNNDGTYTASYAVAARGDYELSVGINGSPIGGSPFPVFFSPPEATAGEQPAALPSATEQSMSMVDTANKASSAIDASLKTANAALSLQPPSVLGPQAHEAGVQFPKEQDVLDRMLLVGNLNPTVTMDQVKQLFAFCGSVTSVSFVGNNNQYALVEYATPAEAAAASAMNGMQVIDRAIAVEQAAVAEKAKEKGSANPYAAIQAAQVQQVMLAQIQQQQLAAQVAAMRVQAKTNPGAVITPGAPQNSASQKAAALSAIAALSKRLTGSGDAFPRKSLVRADSPPRLKKRREISPTIRKRPSRSPSRRRRRSPTPPRRRPRDSSRDRRHDRDDSRDRRRDRDRRPRSAERDSRRDRGDSKHRKPKDRERERSWRDEDRNRERSSRRNADRDRDRSRRDEDRRIDSRRPNRGASRSPKRDAEHPKADHAGADNRDADRRSRDRRRNEEEGRHRDVDEAADDRAAGDEHSRDADAGDEDVERERRAEEARRLRARALEALNSARTSAQDAQADDVGAAALGGVDSQAAAAAQPESQLNGTLIPAADMREEEQEPAERKRSRSLSAEADREEQRKEKKGHKKHKKHKRHHRHRDRSEDLDEGVNGHDNGE